jgi:origin recognition complex subunit 2
MAAMSLYSTSEISDLETSPSRASDHHHTHQPSSLSNFTSFDSYFLHASRPSHTSSNVFSQLVQPLSPDEFATSLSRTFYPLPFPFITSLEEQKQGQGQGQGQGQQLPRYLLELTAGFNLLFYGFGSKRRALNDIARACTARLRAHVLVLNGFQPGLAPRDILAALALLPGAPQGVEGVSRFLSDLTTTAPSTQPRRQRLFLIVHNIDAPALRTGKTRALLSALAVLDGVQLAASVDHINAPLLWTSTEMLRRRWLWHDLTTLASYDVELAGSDPASLRAATNTISTSRASGTSVPVAAESGGLGGGAGGGVGRMTETAARHVLAAVTQRARKLFVLIGRRQLDALADAGTIDPTTASEAAEVAIAYDILFNLARDHFVATNDTALRALLGEFRDHGLVVTVGTGAMGSGEMLWIPLRKERLTKLLEGLQPDVEFQS